LLKARTDVVSSRTENLQLKMAIVLGIQFPEKYKMPGYVYDLQKGWTKKADPVAPAAADPVKK
jgi:hypothetical protein